MNTALWIAQSLLAVAFLVAGGMKIAKSNADLQSKTPYVEDFTDQQITGIGIVEVIIALGLILPAVTGIASILTPLAATGAAIIMVLAAIVHLRRGEPASIAPNVVLGALAVVVAWGRFGPHAF